MKCKKHIEALVNQALIAFKKLEKAKTAYKEWDAIVSELVDAGCPPTSLNGYNVVVVDNFETKNKVWKPCGVSRYDVKITKAS